MKFFFTSAIFWMFKNFDLISIILATCLTWISRFDFSKSVTVIVRDQLSPEPFFLSTSVVHDYSNGSLESALRRFPNRDLIIVYSYSHWDAESLTHKDEIERFAEAVQYRIPVVSVNCWDNNSHCYDVLRPTRFPQVYAYISQSYLVEYKRLIDAMDLFQFVTSLFYPFTFPRSMSDLETALRTTDMAFIACFDSLSSSFDNKVRIFSKIATIYKGEESLRPSIVFIVISESDISFSEFRKTLNLTINEAVLYSPIGFQKKYVGNFNTKDILEFLKTNSFKGFVNKYSSSGIKSLNMQNLLKKGFVLFYIYDESQKYLWNNIKSRFYFETFAKYMTICPKSGNQSTFEFLTFEKQRTITQYLNDHKDNLTCQLYFKSQIYSNYSFNILSYLNAINSNRSSHFSDYLRDPFVIHSTLLDIDWVCRRYQLMGHYHIDDMTKLSENVEFLINNFTEKDFDNLPCFTDFNRSISFAEIDGNRFSSFLQKWGIPLSDFIQPQIVIIDWKNELIHNMNSEISPASLNRLIHQLVIKNLTSHLKSSEYVFRDLFLPNFYPIDAVKLEQELSDSETDLVVFYYTPWCSYCSSMMHLLIMLGRYFRNYSKLHFTSLDTFNNDLPYKYQSERIPALIMFPRGRKSESSVFHITDKSISLSSLVKFVLENSGDRNLNLNSPSVNLDNEYNVTCNRSCLESAQQSIIQLLMTLRRAFFVIKTKFKRFKAEMEKFCSSDDLHGFILKLDQSKDWLDYRIKRYYIRYQAQLVMESHFVLRKYHLLRAKIKKLAKLNGAIRHALESTVLNKSVQMLAVDILNFSS